MGIADPLQQLSAQQMAQQQAVLQAYLVIVILIHWQDGIIY